MKCPKCKAKIDEEDEFCPNCDLKIKGRTRFKKIDVRFIIVSVLLVLSLVFFLNKIDNLNNQIANLQSTVVNQKNIMISKDNIITEKEEIITEKIEEIKAKEEQIKQLTEQKTIVKYQCSDGTIKTKLEDCPKSTETVTQEAQEDCPELSMFEPKQNIFDKDLYTVNYEENRIYGGWKIQCIITCSTNCRKGEKEGENVNYYYCGKNILDSLTLEKTITDKNGNILEIITKNAVIVYDKSFNYIETICE